MIKIIVAFMFAASLLISLQVFKHTPEQSMSTTPLLAKQIGRDAIEVLHDPESIALFFVSPDRASPHHYLATSPEFLLSSGLTSELQQLLLDDEHYVHGMTKLSMFLPSIAFKFHRENATEIIVLLSPVGDQLKVIDGENSFILDYDPAKIVFDNFIQKLENKFQQ